MDKSLEKLLADRNNIEALVLCVGSFDCAHWGHLKYFEEAKKLGTVVVSVCSDRYIKKGINRPLFNELQRVEMVQAFECVDYVILNDEPDCSKLIELIRPSIMVKGREYENKKTPQLEQELLILDNIGASIIYLDTQHASSSHIINRRMSNLLPEADKFLEDFRRKYTFQQVQDEIEKAHRPKITILGETIIDTYVNGTGLGKSSKHPSLVFQELGSKDYLGGIIAIGRHLSSFVDNVEIISYLGEDEYFKNNISEVLNEGNIQFKYIRKNASPTIVKKRFIDNYYQSRLFETYIINQAPLIREDEDALINLLPLSGDIIVGDFGHGLITPRVIEQLYARYTHICANVQNNSGNFGFNLLSKYEDGVYYASVDTLEIQVLMGDRTSPVDSLVETIFKTRDWAPMFLTVTRGKAGSNLYNSFTGDKYVCPSMTAKVVDSIGSGDALYAITSLLMLSKCPLDIVSFVGSVSGAIGCSIVGNERGLTKTELLENIETLLK